jgi:cyanophycinase-like exopeptidase
MKPIYLFADSQLLFWRHEGEPFIERLLGEVDSASPKAAYIGASNKDNPEYYGIFQAALEGIGIANHRMIVSEPSEEQRAFLEEADVVLLAGGDPVHGWRVLERNGVRDIIARRYYEGALLCGVSAGAAQLGWAAYRRDGGAVELAATFRFVPCVIDVHDEDGNWISLKEAVEKAWPRVKGIGIPAGGGLVFHSDDNSIEPIRRPVHECTLSEGTFEERLLLPWTERKEPDTLPRGVH